MMTARGDDYIKQLDAIFAEFGDLLEQVPETGWTAVTTNDGRQINVIFDHAVVAQENLNSVVRNLSSGSPQADLTIEMIDGGNAAHAQATADVTKSAVSAKLNAAVADYRTLIAGLSDAELDKAQPITLFGGNIPAAGVIEYAMIGHSTGHLNDLKAALATN